MHRVYFDSNERTPEGGYVLWLAPSIADLDAITGGPTAEMRVRLYMPDEVECDAILARYEPWGWIGFPVEKTFKIMPEGF